MPFLKTFAKRADEPYRPEPAEVAQPEQGAPTTGAPAAGGQAPTPEFRVELDETAPVAPPKVDLPAPVDVGTLAENLEALDERKLLIDAAQQGATEPLKALREAERQRQQGADISDVDRTAVQGYLLGEEPKATYRTVKGDDRPVAEMFARPVVGLPPSKQKELEEFGDDIKLVRTFGDVSADVFADALKAQYVRKAEDRKAGGEAYRADLQALTDSGFFEANAEARPASLREAEKALARIYGRRMAGPDAAQGVNLLEAVVRDAGTQSLNLVESTLLRRAGATASYVAGLAGLAAATADDDVDTGRVFEPFTGVGDVMSALFAGVRPDRLTEDDAERAMRLEKEVAETIPTNVVAEAVKRNRAGIKPSFSDLRGFERPQVKALREVDDETLWLVKVAQSIGLDPKVLVGISQAEGNHNPRAMAFNLDNARRHMTPEQIELLDQRLAEKMGYKRPAKKGVDEPFYGQDAKKVLAEVAAINPAAAARATAFGQFQVLGAEGSGDVLGLAREVYRAQRPDDGRELTDNEAAQVAFQLFQDDPRAMSAALAQRWWNHEDRAKLKDQVNAGDYSQLLKTYTGGHYEDVRGPNGEKGADGVPDWLNRFALGQKSLEPLTAMFEQAPAEAAAPEPTMLKSGEDLPPSLEAQREADVRQQELTGFSGTTRFVADLFTPGNLAGELVKEQAAERDLGVKFTRVKGQVVDLAALEHKAWMPRAGTERYEVSTRTWRSIAQNAPEQAQRLMDISQRAMGSGFDLVRQDVEAKYVQEIEKARREGREVDYQKIKQQINLEALDVITSMQVSGVWTTPIYVSFDQLMGKEETEGWLRALSPRIEVLGRSGDEVIFRSEGGGMALLNMMDAVPVIGQSYNVGVVENYLLPALGNRVDEVRKLVESPSLQNAAALGMGIAKTVMAPTVLGIAGMALTGDLAELHRAGVRGVAGRANLAEFTMDSSYDIANALVETGAAESVLETLVDADLVPFIPEDMTTDTRVRTTAAKDMVRSMSRLSALPAGMMFAIAHPDLLGGLASATRSTRVAGQTLLALPSIDKMLDPAVIGGLDTATGARMNGRQLLFAHGDRRLTATTTIVNDLESLATLAADPAGADAAQVNALTERLAAALPALGELDALDASRRQASPILQEQLDKLTAEFIASSVEAGRPEAAALTDKNLALRVGSIVEAITKNTADIADPVRRAKAERLKELTDTGAGGIPAAFLTIEPGAARRVFPGVEVKSGMPFDTARRVEALQLAIELFDDVEDSFIIRRRALSQRLEQPLGSWGRTAIDDLGLDMPDGVAEVTPLTAVQVFGPVSEQELRASRAFQRMDPQEQAAVLGARHKLEEFTARLQVAAMEDRFDGSLMNPDVADALFGEIKASGIIDKPLSEGGLYSPLIYRNRRSTAAGSQFNRAALALRAQAEAVAGSSTAQQDLFLGLSAALSYNLHRGVATKNLARALVDPQALGVAADASQVRRDAAVDAFLSVDPRTTLGERMMNAVAAGTREGVVSLLGSMGLGKGTGSKAAARAKASQMTMDGSRPEEVARAMQLEVLNRLRARRQALIEAYDAGVEAPDSVNDIERALAEVDTDEWRARLVDWMTQTVEARNARAAGQAAPEVAPFEMPVAIDTTIFTGGRRGYRVTKATRSFVKDSGFMTAYGFAGEESRDTLALGQRARGRKKKLSRTERDAAMTVLDQMVRFMAKVDPGDAPEIVETKMADWYRQHIRGLRRTVSESAYAKRLRKLDAEFYDAVNDVVEELLDSSVEDFIAETLADPTNVKVPTLDELRPGRVAIVTDDAGQVVDSRPFEVYSVGEDGLVTLRSMDTREATPPLPVDRLRVLTGEADETLNQIIRKAQLTALDTLLPTMSDAEAQSLFGASLANLQEVVARLQRGQPVDQRFAKYLDQDGEQLALPLGRPPVESARLARIAKADRSREELVAQYEKMGEDSLVNLMGRRGLKMPEVGESVQLSKMSDKELMIEALVADDMVPVATKRAQAQAAAVEAKDYDAMSPSDLKAEIDARNEGRAKADRVLKTGNKATLAERLRADDAAQAAARGEAPAAEGFVPAQLPEQPDWGNARRLKGNAVPVEARREVRVSDPLLDEDIVSYEPARAEIIRRRVGVREDPVPYRTLRKNFIKYLVETGANNVSNEVEAAAVADKIGKNRLPEAVAEYAAEAEGESTELRKLLNTTTRRAVHKYEHNLDPSVKFDTPEEALADVNARLSEPDVRQASFEQVRGQLGETEQSIIAKAIDKANEGDGTLNIATFRAVAPKASDETLKGLLDLMNRTKVTEGSPKPGRVALNERAADEARANIEAFFDPKTRAERVASSIDAFERINQLDVEALTRPELIPDEQVREFLTRLRDLSPQEYGRMVAARQRSFVDEIEGYEQEIVKLHRMIARMKRRVPTHERRRAVRLAAIARSERLIAEYQSTIDALSEHVRAGAPQVEVDLAGITGAARARRERGAIDGAPPAPPRDGDGLPVPGDVPPTGMPKGMVYFINDTSAILYAFRQADISTGLHEMSHVLRRQLDPDDLRVVTDWVNQQLADRGYDAVELVEGPGGRIDFDFASNPEAVVEAEELFARAFERYLREGDTSNSLLQKAFATMRDALMRIYAAIKGKNIDVPISPEMYDLFDKVFGAKKQVTINELRDVQGFLDLQFDLSRGGTRRLTARIAEQEQVEDTAEGSLRQFIASVKDYRARGFTTSLLDKALEPELTHGPVGSATGDKSFQLGPVSRRAMTLEKVTEAREAGQVPAALRAADEVAVYAGTAAAVVLQGLFVGGDAARMFRLVPPTLRATMNGSAREVEEFMSELSMRLIDISRMKPEQRRAALTNLINYARGRNVRMQTGAQRGQRARANFVDTEHHFFRQLQSFVNTLSGTSRDALAYDVGEVLNGRSAKWGALSGFWRGYAVDTPPPQQLADAADNSFVSGLGLSDEIEQVIAAAGGERKMRVSELQQEMLENVYGAVSGTNGLPANGQVSDEAIRLGAEMLFLSGKAPVTVDGVVFTVDDLPDLADAGVMQWLFFGGQVEKDGAVLRLKGIHGITSDSTVDAPSRAVGALAMVMQSGYVAGVYDDLRKLGFGLSSTDARIVGKYLAGDAASMPLEDIARAKEIVRVFGRTTFDVSPASLGNFYVPAETRAAIAGQVRMGLRQVGLQKDLEIKGQSTLLSWMLAYYQSMIIFGSVFQRQAFKLMSTQDLALGIGAVVGGAEGAAAAARVIALTMLSALGGERIAEAAESAAQVASRLHGRPLSQEMFKARLREYVTAKGDEAVNTITDFFGASKFRVEVNPILENQDRMYVIGGRVYNARDLRKVFTQAGMYSNAFKEMRRDWWRNLFDEKQVDALPPENRNFYESAKSVAKDFFSTEGARRWASTVFEHGVESADAWSDLERTGAAVTLMEFGYTPRDAARLVVESVYDYRGSMTEGDRGWMRRILMPFWAFRKNANVQVMNFLASPEGSFRIRAIQKASRIGAESFTSVIYEAMLQPYDVDISVMPPKVKDVYYQTRTILEMGFGDTPPPEVLAEYREQLPPEARDISDEELLDYSFDGWTVRDGFGGYTNVPERFRIAFRAIISGNTSGMVRQQGGLYRLSDALAQQEVADFYIQMGGKMAARAAAGDGGLPAWAAKRPTVQVPLPEMTESAREVIDYIKRTATREGEAPDPGDSFYFVLPDNFVMSAVEHGGAMLASMVVIAGIAGKTMGVDAAQGGEPPGLNKADAVRLLNAIEPVVDVRDYGSPQGQLVASLIEAVQGGTTKVRLHALTARLIEEGLSVPLPSSGGKSAVVPGTAAAARVLGATGGEVFADESRGDRFSRMVSRPVKVVVRDAAGRLQGDDGFDPRTASRRVEVDAGPFSAADYTVPNSGPPGQERMTYQPYLYGPSAVWFQTTFLGQVNKWLLDTFGDGPIEASMLNDGSAANAILNMAIESYELAGGRVMEADYGRTASMEKGRQ